MSLIAARAIGTTPFYLVGYGLFWLWAIALCVHLLRKPGAERAEQPVHHPQQPGDEQEPNRYVLFES